MGGTTPQLRQFRYFVAVAEELHFGRAARRLYIAQPALSQAIARLETELGVRLLDRTSRRVVLTAPGRVFLERARRTLASADRAVEIARGADAGLLGSIVVGVSPTVRLGIAPAAARAFAERYPDVRITSQEMFSGPIVDAVARGDLSVAFAHYPQPLPRLRADVVVRERAVVLAGAGTALAKRSSVRIAELAGETHVLWPADTAPGLRDHIVGLCRDAGFEPVVENRLPETNADGRLYRDGVGVTIVPESIRKIGYEGVAALDVEDDVWFESAIVWAENAPAAVRRFVAVTLEVAAAGGWLDGA